MEVIAHARFIHMTPRKVRLIADLVRGMDVARAEAQLRFYSKAAARPVLKLIQSAVANAEHNFKISPETLYIKKLTVDVGPSLKRWRARAFGRAAGIKKRMSHITVVLDQRGMVNAPKGSVSSAVVAPSKAPAKAKKATAKLAVKKAAPKKAKS